MWRLFQLGVVLVAMASPADVRFVAPLEGSQVLGKTVVEIETDIPNIDRVEFHVDGRLVGVARKSPYRMSVDFGETLASHRVIAEVYSKGYTRHERAAIVTMASTASAHLDVDLVEVPARIRSSRTAISPSDFSVRENGVEQRLLEIRNQRLPAHFVFVVDRSLSMGDGKLGAALGAIESSLRRLRAEDEASIVFFNHRIEPPRRLAKGDTVELRRLTVPSGGTALRDAVASLNAKRRTIVILISDGSDRNSLLSESKALERMSNRHLTLYALTYDSRVTPFVRKAAERTGGTHRATSVDTISRDLDELFADINSRYVFVYQSSLRDRGWREISLRGNRRGIDVLGAKRGYTAQ